MARGAVVRLPATASSNTASQARTPLQAPATSTYHPPCGVWGSAPLPKSWLQPYCLSLFLLLALLCPPAARAAVSIVDDAGQTITLAAPAQRIIPLYSALSETLAAMGCTPRIVARTAADTTLPESLPSIGTHMRPNLELVAGLAPDLAVQMEGREEAAQTAERLGRLGIPVARFRVASFAELFSCITRLGVLTGEKEAAAALVRDMQRRLAAVKEKTVGLSRTPSVFFEVRYPNLLGAGGGSMVNEIISAAGGRNCLAAYPEKLVRLSEEMLILMNPDLYLLQQGAMNKNPQPPGERGHFSGLKAVRNGFVFLVPEERFSRPGPQSVDAVEELSGHFLQWNAGNK